MMTPEYLDRLIETWSGKSPLLTPIHAMEGNAPNQIPAALAAVMQARLGWRADDEIVQINRVSHTKSSGWHRLAHQALFGGKVQPGKDYLLLDDFIGQGGTFANLKGFIEHAGGRVVGAIALAGKPYSATLQLSAETLTQLRSKHGELENWWINRLGFGFDSLTESEGRYLLRAEDADTIRNRLAEAE